MGPFRFFYEAFLKYYFYWLYNFIFECPLIVSNGKKKKLIRIYTTLFSNVLFIVITGRKRKNETKSHLYYSIFECPLSCNNW